MESIRGRERGCRGGCSFAGVGRCGVEARGVCAWSIIRNSFGYIAISIVLNRKTSFYVIAEKWLKRTYIMNGREGEGKKRGEIEKAACSVGAGSV